MKSREECNASLELEEISSTYDFLGGTWRHDDGTIQAGPKLLQKLPTLIPNQMTASELEGLIGRLIFIAQMHQEPLVNHYWLLKWARRFFNALNNGKISSSQIVQIPKSASHSLSRWLSLASKPHKIRFSKFSNNNINNNKKRSAVLFTDASLVGYGGVLILDDGAIHVVGGKFSVDDHNNNIATAEAKAVNNSIRDLKQIISSVARLDILVDNTSVEAGVRRGMPRSDALADSVKQFWSTILAQSILVTVGRVSTRLNPADSISRGKPLDFPKLEQAYGNFQNEQNNRSNERKGLGERHLLS